MEDHRLATPPPAASTPASKRGGAASHEPPQPAPDRSRSAQWRARLLPGARCATGHHDANDTVRESARKLQDVATASGRLEVGGRQRAAHRSDFLKLLWDNANSPEYLCFRSWI